ncbi:MAG: hypothetical protein AAGD13_18820 [Pseudomonadota bacterium]
MPYDKFEQAVLNSAQMFGNFCWMQGVEQDLRAAAMRSHEKN